MNTKMHIIPRDISWKDALSEELNALLENETFELAPLPEGRTTVEGK